MQLVEPEDNWEGWAQVKDEADLCLSLQIYFSSCTAVWERLANASAAFSVCHATENRHSHTFNCMVLHVHDVHGGM
jgi:hypothetical protein